MTHPEDTVCRYCKADLRSMRARERALEAALAALLELVVEPGLEDVEPIARARALLGGERT